MSTSMRCLLTALALVLALDRPAPAQEIIGVATPAGTEHAMVHVPAGPFTMGSTAQQRSHLFTTLANAGMHGGEEYHGTSEEEAHTVYLDAFYIAQYELTNAEWNAYAEAVGEHLKPEPDDHVAIRLSWQDAHGYCAWAGLRLATEAEWEKAARGTEGQLFPWGDEFEIGRGNSWVEGDGNFDGYETTAPVGSFPSGVSPYGAHDMSGNAWEWVQDWFGAGYYETGSQVNPTGPLAGFSKIARGGSLISPAELQRTTVRAVGPPDSRAAWGGIRCALDGGEPSAYPRLRSARLTPGAIARERGARVELEIELEQALTATGMGANLHWDLSLLGGPTDLPLSRVEDTVFRGTAGIDALATGQYLSLVLCETVEGELLRLDPVPLEVWPTRHLPIFADGMAPDWQLTEYGFEDRDLAQSVTVHDGATAGSFRVGEGSGNWSLTLTPDEPVQFHGYALRFAFHPGDTVPPSRVRIRLSAGGPTVDLLKSGQIDLDKSEWQVVEVPAAALVDAGDHLSKLLISGILNGTFFIDDIQLVAPELPQAPTAVVEERSAASVPRAFALGANYPNPFNSGTLISFALPHPAEVELSLYNLAGQRVATLARGGRPAGAYTLHWDGRDDAGRDLATGTYLYTLRAGERLEARKLLLLR